MKAGGAESDGGREVDTSKRGTRGKKRLRHRQEMEDMWLRGETTKFKKESENVGFVKMTRKTTKKIQSLSKFTVTGPPSQGCVRLWLMGHKRA